KLPTGGATAGGGVAEFLRAEEREGSALIRELVASAEPAPEPAPVVVAKTPPTPAPAAAGVLDELVAPAPAAAASEPAPPPPPPGQADRKVDRSVIEGLLDQEDRQA
ncbi:MAG: hypothetical protein NTV86_22265, partial [Planctomycetota bacterium]|nr:hypothetical protein [Planctomycetota bacterium]